MSDLHEAVFRWPYNASEVIVTGTFDKWSRSVRLSKSPTGFVATVRVPWEERVLYKFIVDGRWTTIDQAPTEVDWRGNVNNVYNAPAKPKDVTPRYDPPAAKEPKITPVPAPVPVEKKEALIPAPQPTKQGSVEVPVKPKQEPVKNDTPVVNKGPSPADVKVTPSEPKVAPVPVVLANDTKPVDTPPVKTEKVPVPDKTPTTVQPAPPNLKAPLPIIPVNDATTVDKRPPVVEPPKHTETPSTHGPPVNSPRKASTGTSSSNTLLTEKKEEETKGAKPEGVKQPNGNGNGTVNGREPTKEPPSTPTKAKTPVLPATPSSTATFPSPPTTPKKSFFPGSKPSPPSSPGGSVSRRSSFLKKRDSFVHKVKHLFTPEKDKKEHKREKSHG